MSLFKYNNNNNNKLQHQSCDDPFFALQTDINKLFSHFLTDPFSLNIDKPKRVQPFRVDLKETPTEFVLVAELPGFDKKDISVMLEDDMLVIKGERKVEEVKKDEKYHYMERSYGTYERRFSIDPNRIDKAQKISAKFDNGLLTVSLAKKPEEQKASKVIEIE